ncbi:hypothetical protein HW555_009439 [Spodoptera exigua]|uniref:Uncharacterized protein n=1 Tax=Spodoptera exigua TaxID=7107 RepID=A0A835GD28_SPOEX|nr:hypothetical protein HW555_009439 [Spodoptera exigua]
MNSLRKNKSSVKQAASKQPNRAYHLHDSSICNAWISDKLPEHGKQCTMVLKLVVLTSFFRGLECKNCKATSQFLKRTVLKL